MTVTLTRGGFSRRGFIGGVGASGLAATLPLTVLAEAAGAAPPDPDQGILLVVFLRGGNDSLNTLGPFNDGTYRDQRLSLAQSPSAATSAGGNLWFHPSLPYLRHRYLQGDVAVLPAIGEPNDDHSHFSSTTTWMTGRLLGENRSLGWLGRWLDDQADDVLGATVSGSTARHVKGTKQKVIGVPRSSGNLLPTSSRYQLGNQTLWRHNGGALSEMGNQFGDALRVAAQFSNSQRPLYAEGVVRSSDRFAADLERAAHVLNLGLGVRIVSATLGGFDTHSDQGPRHADKLTSLDLGIQGFFNTLLPALHGQTSVLVVSEFGRRIRRNNSLGTDHGSAGMAFLIGSRVKGGLAAPYPSLTDVTRRGDLKYSQDFRSLYTTVAQRWLATDGTQLLGASFPEFDLFEGGPRGTGVAGFLDVDGSMYYAGALTWAAGTGVVAGTSPTTFDPHRKITRAEFATIVWRSAGEPAPARPSGFHDIPRGAFCEDAVAWMVEAGITTGTSATHFTPNRTLTRGEAATLLWRWRGRPARVASHTFDDVPPGRYFTDAVRWMAAEGITTGTRPRQFSPHDPVDRAQAVTFLWREAGQPSAP